MANLVAERMGDGIFLSFASSAETVQLWGGKVDLRKVELWNDDAMVFLGASNTQVYLVQLKQHQVVNRYMVVNGNRRVLMDSAETYPLKLSSDDLRLCGADSASDLVFREVREVIAQEDGVNQKQTRFTKDTDFFE